MTDPAGAQAPAIAENPCAITTATVGITANSAQHQKELKISSIGQVGSIPHAAEPREILKELSTAIVVDVASYLNLGSVAGWVMKALWDASEEPIPDQVDIALDKFTGQMAAMGENLREIKSSLSTIESLIKDQTYLNAIFQLESQHIAPILTMWQRECDLLVTRDDNRATSDQLATDILNAHSGVRAHATALARAFTGGSSVTQNIPLPGMFSEFAKNQGLVPEFDDQPFYKDVMNPFSDYFVSLQVMAMTLETDAWHLKGDISQAKRTIINRWDDIRAIYKAGGFPISDGRVVTQFSTRRAWSREGLSTLAKFNSSDYHHHQQNPEPVNKLLVWTSVVTPKDISPFSKGDEVSFFYGGAPYGNFLQPAIAKLIQSDNPNPYLGDWGPPTKAQIDALVAGHGTINPAQYLNEHGFRIGVKVQPKGRYNVFYDIDNPRLAPKQYDLAQRNDLGWPYGVILVSTHLNSYLGKGSYKGALTAPGDSWLNLRWPAKPRFPPSSRNDSTDGSSFVPDSSTTYVE